MKSRAAHANRLSTPGGTQHCAADRRAGASITLRHRRGCAAEGLTSVSASQLARSAYGRPEARRKRTPGPGPPEASNRTSAAISLVTVHHVADKRRSGLVFPAEGPATARTSRLRVAVKPVSNEKPEERQWPVRPGAARVLPVVHAGNRHIGSAVISTTQRSRAGRPDKTAWARIWSCWRLPGSRRC